MTERPDRPAPSPSLDWQSFEQLQRRDWELWSIALLLLTVFAGGALVLFYSEQTFAELLSPGVTRFVWLILFGLVILVVLLNVYLIDRKRSLAKLWHRYHAQAEELAHERQLALQDPLTQVYNRRFLDEFMPSEIRRCERTSRPLSLLLVNLDNTKDVDERLGHLVGDQVLQEVATLLRDCVRATDPVVRYAGDEFLLILPETPAKGAAIVEARLQQRLSQCRDIHERIGRPLTMTIGRATYTKGQTFESVIEKAEQAVQQLRQKRRTPVAP